MTRRDDLDIARALASAVDEGRPCVLATVVATRGSTPRKVGARMVVEPGRGLTGTIGGGCGEAEVIEAADEVLRTGRPRRVNVMLTDDLTSWSPAVCGGVMEVFVEAAGGDGGGAAREAAPGPSARSARDANAHPDVS